MCHQPPGTDVCITFMSPLMRERFIIGASKPDCVLCQFAAGMSSGWSNAAGRFCVMFLKNMVKKPTNI